MPASRAGSADVVCRVGHHTVAGSRLEYRLWEPGAAGARRPTLVLLHEGLGSVAMWKDFPLRLARHTGCPVFAYSRAGYGSSSPAHLPRTPDYMHPEGLAVLPAVLERLAAPEVVIIGHSDGASIALIHAGGVTDARLTGLVLMAPHVFIEPMCVAQIARARDAYLQGDLRGRLAKYHADVDHVFWGWNDIWLHPDFPAWNIEAYLPRISAPVLVLQGAQDEYGTLAQVDAVVHGIGSRVDSRIIPDCGHSLQRDQPEATLGAIGAFLSRCVMAAH